MPAWSTSLLGGVIAESRTRLIECEGGVSLLDMEASWTELELEREALLGYAQGKLGSRQRHLAEDLVHDVLVSTLTANPKHSSREGLAAYLRRALLNRMATRWKRIGIAREEPLPAGEHGPQEPPRPAPQLDVSELRCVRGKLPFEAEVALFLRGDLGCSFETLAVILDKRTANAASRFHSRSLKQLAQLVERGCTS